jgi:hypothetical protein
MTFPIAADPIAALSADLFARTAAEARSLAGGPVELVSEWLPADRAEGGHEQAGFAAGYVQIYEDMSGRRLLSVRYWRPSAPPAAAPARPTPEDDTTDDLYFSKPTARARRRRTIDPHQLDFFVSAPAAPGAADPAVRVAVVDEDPA